MTRRLGALGTLLPTFTLVLLAAPPSLAQTTQPVSITSVTAPPTCPMALGSSGSWQASAVGGVQALLYKFWLYDETTNVWTLLADYRDVTGVSWRPTAAGSYRVQVWVRSSTSSAAFDAWQNSASCTVLPAPATVVTGLSASPPPPDASGSPVTWTATASGGAPPLQYRFLVRNETTQVSSVLQDWSPANTAAWTPAGASTYSATVEVRSWANSGPAEASRTSAYLVPVAGSTTRVSLTNGGTEANDESPDVVISADGRFVAFESDATNLVPGDVNGVRDIFVRDRISGTTSLVSVSTAGVPGDAVSTQPTISADGRFVAFSSRASNLVPDRSPTRNTFDVYVRDRQAGTTTRVSVASDGTESNLNSEYPSITADGRAVAFISIATNLVPGDTNGEPDLFVHDLTTRTTTRVSLTPTGGQLDGAVGLSVISGDGRFCAYESSALNLLPGATTAPQVYLLDRLAGATTRVSAGPGGVAGNAVSFEPSISYDGRYVAFQSASDNLVPNDTNQMDVFVFDRLTGQLTRASESADGVSGDGASSAPSLSADGRFVAFYSAATNLVPGDTNGLFDVFLRDIRTGAISRVSMTSGGAESTGALGSLEPAVNGDGRVVAFTSMTANLVANDLNNSIDVFVRERGEAARPQLFRVWSELIAQPGQAVALFAAGSGGPLANEYKFWVKQQGGGWTMLRDWASSPSLVWTAPPPGTYFVEVWMRAAGSFNPYDAYLDSAPFTISPPAATTVTSLTHNACPAAVGRWVATTATATGGTAPLQYAFYQQQPNGQWTLLQAYGPSNRLLWRPQTTGVHTIQAWVRSAGSVVQQEANLNASCTATIPPPVTSVTATSAVPLPMKAGVSTSIVAEALGGAYPLEYACYARDEGTGQWTLVRAYAASESCPWVPAAGRYTFEVWARSVGSPNAYDAFADLPVRVVPAATRIASVSTANVQGNANSDGAAVSANGRYVTFDSEATNLVTDGNGARDVFVRDLVSNATTRVSVSTGGTEANGPSYAASISADGRYVAFVSDATNLVPNDTNGVADVFVRDRIAGTTERMSVASQPAGGAQGNNASGRPSISADGRLVAFESEATNLVPADTNGVSDIFVRDRVGQGTVRVSLGPGGTQLGGASYAPSINADGRFVAFDSVASTLVAADTNGASDVFVVDRVTSAATRVSVATGGAQAGGNSYAPSISADGRYVAFESAAPDLVAADTNVTWDVFVRDRTAGTTTRASVDTTGREAAGPSWYPALSSDGRVVAFQSTANNLTSDGLSAWNVYVKTLPTGAIIRPSDSDFGATNYVRAPSFAPALSGDGRFAAFTSRADSVIFGDFNLAADVFVGDTGDPGPPSVLQVSYASNAWTTYAAGGTAALEYKFYLFRQGVGWSLLRDWGATSSVNWNAPGPGTYYVQGWVRTGGSTADVAEAALNSATLVVP